MKADVEVLAPNAIDVFTVTSDFNKFANIANERIDLKRQKDTIEARIKELNDLLTPALCNRDCVRVSYSGFTFAIITKVNEKLDRIKLLENGVAASVIAASMTVSQSSYLEVREQKAKKATG